MSLKYIFLLPLILCVALVSSAHFVLIIDPSDSPRKLAASFAKGATLQCAEALQKKIEDMFSIQTSITRSPGSKSTHENHAQMSNRLGAQLYVHISFFQELEVKPRLCIYYYANGSEPTQLVSGKQKFCSYECAHYGAHHHTITLANKFYNIIASSASSLYRVMAPLGIPCAPLIGITAPALMIEIGLHTAHTWQDCVEPLAQALGTLVEQI
jgi:hypothetical protein